MATTAQSVRRFTGPVFFERGFRPFFFGGALFAGLAVPLWTMMLATGDTVPSYLSGRDWHIHEMVFGFLPAVFTGFLLTAIPNWTGRLPFTGMRLAGLFALWLAGRVAIALSGLAPLPAAVIDSIYLIVVTLLIVREILAGGNKRNLPVAAIVAIIAVANAGFHARALGGGDFDIFVRLGLAGVAGLLILIGGRVTPSFTRNWLARQPGAKLPAPLGPLDKAAMLSGVAAITAWVFLPQTIVSSLLFAIAAIATAVRLSRWRGLATTAEPLVTILHIGYGWLVVWMALMALSGFGDTVIEPQRALHALTAGAAGTMTLAVMTRASLGHSGRRLTADRTTQIIYLLVIAGGVLRVIQGWLPFDAVTLSSLAGGLWSAGFLLFAIAYFPVFFMRRKKRTA